mgnify:CR=1 FL=1
MPVNYDDDLTWRERRHARVAAGLCRQCGAPRTAGTGTLCARHAAHQAEAARAARARDKATREADRGRCREVVRCGCGAVYFADLGHEVRGAGGVAVTAQAAHQTSPSAPSAAPGPSSLRDTEADPSRLPGADLDASAQAAVVGTSAYMPPLVVVWGHYPGRPPEVCCRPMTTAEAQAALAVLASHGLVGLRVRPARRVRRAP